MKKFFMVTSLVATMLTLAACGSSNSEEASSTAAAGDEKVTLTFSWWGGELRHNSTQEAVELYEELNPNVDIQVEYSSWDDYWKKLATKSASGDLPDVMQMDLQYISQYGLKNQLSDLSEFAVKGGAIDTTYTDESLVEGSKIGDELFGFPISKNALSMLTNTSALADTGVTIDYENWDFEDWKQVVSDVHEKTGKYGMVDVGDIAILFSYYLRTEGESLYTYDDEGNPSLNYTDENFTAFFETMQGLVAEGAMPTPEVVKNVKSFDENPFALGESALMETWTNQYNLYNDATEDELSLDLVYGANNENNPLSYRQAMFYSIAETSEYKEEAADFIDWIVNSTEAADILGTERGISTNSQVVEHLSANMTEIEKETADYLTDIADVVGDPEAVPPLGYTEINTLLNDMYSEVAYGEKDVKSFCDEFRVKAEEVLADNY